MVYGEKCFKYQADKTTEKTIMVKQENWNEMEERKS